MPTYRKIPVTVEAFRIGFDPVPDWFTNNRRQSQVAHKAQDEPLQFPIYEIDTNHGTVRAGHGDYIIKGAVDEIYPCRPDVFELTYQQPEMLHQKVYERLSEISSGAEAQFFISPDPGDQRAIKIGFALPGNKNLSTKVDYQGITNIQNALSKAKNDIRANTPNLRSHELNIVRDLKINAVPHSPICEMELTFSDGQEASLLLFTKTINAMLTALGEAERHINTVLTSKEAG